MAILIDSNLVLEIVRDNSVDAKVKNYVNPKNEKTYISYVTVAEIKSLASQSKWGTPKLDKLEQVLQDIYIIDIELEAILQAYITIDTFSQGELEGFSLKGSAKNMGKNDLWIAATAHVLKVPLFTTDKDFHHLKDVFVNLKWINPTIIYEIRHKK